MLCQSLLFRVPRLFQDACEHTKAPLLCQAASDLGKEQWQCPNASVHVLQPGQILHQTLKLAGRTHLQNVSELKPMEEMMTKLVYHGKGQALPGA